ncbi:DUF3237 domain-containing protein [Rhodocaloribacter litoris]|uniref:DUF3237 domain-containing protein n=1 Tax=Rhodocaloribacter litoris TaxID=2558931 RepID=UPI001E57AE57|nr:DUF3237 domain-containing protein [Rhodocaloribacter litoris]QXD15651.1 DUF3237 domain-containing protein [Rhodocaloribacter litoris]
MTRLPLFLIATTFSALIPVTTYAQKEAPQPERPLVYEWLFDVTVELEPSLVIGPTGAGQREVYPIRSGSIEGPHLQAEILPGGNDWVLRREDGSLLLDIRSVARTRDGNLISAAGRGYFSLTPQGIQQMQEGKPVPASEQYFRVAYTFEAGAEPYAWLNRTLTVGVGEFRPGWVKVSVYAIR